MNKGFTLVELMVSVGIFVLMTGLLLFKYGTFNQGILITNLAYDTALTIRSAQSFALNVQNTGLGVDTTSQSAQFSNAYGVHFDNSTAANAGKFILFVNSDINNGSNVYTASGANASGVVSTYTMKGGSKVTNICVLTNLANCGGSGTVTSVDIIFRRPNPDAVIAVNGAVTPLSNAQLTLTASDGSTKKIIVRFTGQIQISN